ncbi:MAG: phosphodiester glycosidase family protein [Armatimonadetes bacterium]|nr:phosphodiester glycosidase family protein [Armatimonadota bacterium]
MGSFPLRFKGEKVIAVISSFVIGLLLAVMGSLVSFLAVCLGVTPGVLLPSQTIVPALSLVLSGYCLGRRSEAGRLSRRAALVGSLILALIWIVLWWFVWCWLTTRLRSPEWLRWGTAELTPTHARSWIGAVLLVLLGFLGGRGSDRARWLLLAGILTLLLLPVSGAWPPKTRQAGHGLPSEWNRIQSWGNTHLQRVSCEGLGSGVTMLSGTDLADSTRWNLMIFNFHSNPRLRLSLYDIDQHDFDPGNDVNYSYYGLNVFWLVPRVNRMLGEGRRLVALFNGCFFYLGRPQGFRGRHVEPEVVDGRLLYPMRDESRWTFGVRYQSGRPQFDMVSNAAPKSLTRRFDCAVMGTQGLVNHGQRLRIVKDAIHPETTIHPIPVIDTLLTDRTSLGWNENSTRFYVLIVDDPDGETASQRQKRSGRRQTGGWDIPRMQDFWMSVGVDSAINLDGGGSTQLAYRVGGLRRARYGYVLPGALGWTFGYWDNRPIRIEPPVLPPWIGHSGVLNYFYVYEDTEP